MVIAWQLSSYKVSNGLALKHQFEHFSCIYGHKQTFLTFVRLSCQGQKH